MKDVIATPAFAQPISEQIWSQKYKFQTDRKGFPSDQTVQDTWSRLASSCAQGNNMLTKRFYTALEDFKFLPAGRIISGTGTGRNVTLFNCYVMGTVPDSLDGIFDHLKEAALTMQQGGGIGYDFSTLRPKGAPVRGVESFSSGPLTFMDVWNTMCKTIMSAGHRRGAMMATMRCDHPDIEEFILAKKDPLRLRHFNVSVLCTDEFMKALEHDSDWDLIFNGEIYKTVKAQYLWNLIMENTYSHAEPGVIFIDRINQENNLWDQEIIAATNPCVAGDTPILTDKGWVQIQDTVNQKINVWNGFEFSEVTTKITGHDQDMWTVYLSDGSELRCTGNHKFILNDGFRVEAKDLQPNQALEKSEWPVIDGTDEHAIDYYAQGFFSGDGWVKASTGAQYIGLYGEKKSINHNWNERSRNTYAIAGGYQNTDLSEMKEYLYFPKGTFLPKSYVPVEASIKSKREWLAGIADTDGTVTKDGSIQISAKDRNFLLDIKALLNTMGANGNLKPMKTCYRISISASHVHALNIPTKRLVQTVPSRDTSRFVRVVNVMYSGKEETVFCFTEPKNHSGVFNGVYTAQCGEQPLPPYGACLLGSINLAKMITKPFSINADIDMSLFDETVRAAVRMLDSVIDISKFPLEAQEIEAKNKRRMGLGVTGVADMFFMIGAHYDSNTARDLLDTVLYRMAETAYEESIQLAKEKGPAPCLKTKKAREKFIRSGFMKRMPEHIRDDILEHGIRNSHLLSIAPTGTISMYGGNVSSGIEPIFATGYERKITQADGSKTTEVVRDYAVHLYKEMGGVEGDPWWDAYMCTAQDLDPAAHLNMQATAQRWIDSSISKTINLPEDISFEDFKQVYIDAYYGGCKGCTTYRPNDVTGSVLTAISEDKPKEEILDPEVVLDQVFHDMRITERPDQVDGKTYKIKWGGVAYYVTFNQIPHNGTQIPFEMFIATKSQEHQAWISALTRMVSAIFQRGGDVRFVVDEMKSVYDAKGGEWSNGKYVPSLVALLGETLERHMKEIGYLTGESLSEPVLVQSPDTGKIPDQCPSCQGFNMHSLSGCPTCGDCGYSKCS